MEQRHSGHCLTASAFRIHRHRNTADIVHGHRLRRKEDRGVEAKKTEALNADITLRSLAVCVWSGRPSVFLA